MKNAPRFTTPAAVALLRRAGITVQPAKACRIGSRTCQTLWRLTHEGETLTLNAGQLKAGTVLAIKEAMAAA